MKPIEFHIENFMGIKEAHLSLANKGLCLIQGVNDGDTSAVSNGAGKSTIAEALFWCLYGETARGLSADKVVNRTTNKGCHVTVVMEEDDGTRHTVSRWRKKTIGGKKNGCSLVTADTAGVETDQTKGTDKLTQVEIDKAIGCSKEVFLAAVYAAQKRMPNLPEMTDTELKTLIEEASGVDSLIKAYKIAREKLGLAENDIDRWRLNHVHAERNVNDIQDRLKDLNSRKALFEGEKKSKLTSLAATVRDEVSKARHYQTQRDDVNVANIQKAIDKLDAAIASVHGEQEEEARLVTEASDAASKHTVCKANYNRSADEARMQRTRLDGIMGRVGTPCGECGKPYCEDDIGDASDIATAKLRDLIAKARELKEDAEAFEKVSLEASRKLTQHRADRTDIRSTVEERRRLADLLASRNTAEASMLHHTTAAKTAKTQFDKLTAETNPFVDLVSKGEADLKEGIRAHRDSEGAGVGFEKRVQVCKETVKVFGPAGVRAHILDNVTPYLNDRTADYLGTLSDGLITAMWSTLSLNAKGELAEKFAINVDKVDDADSFAGLSGGEQKKVQMATALALQDLVASRATKPVGIWIGDEIDDALDAAGLERLMTILEQKARDRGTVLVISHNSLNDWIRDTATVTRGVDKFSRVDGCLNL